MVADRRYRLARSVARYALAAFIVWQARLAVDALAGQTTSVDVAAVLGVFTDLRVTVSLTLAGGAAAWAVVERKLRQRVIVRMHSRIQELEGRLDPGRSSSGLTTKGLTGPADREM
jgi:hypothetical protein